MGAGVPAPPYIEIQKNNEEKDKPSDHTERENDIQNQEDDCITSEEAIEGNVKKVSIEARDKTKYDPMAFLKVKEEKIRQILKVKIRKRQRIKFYITLQVRFTKNKGDQVETREGYKREFYEKNKFVYRVPTRGEQLDIRQENRCEHPHSYQQTYETIEFPPSPGKISL